MQAANVLTPLAPVTSGLPNSHELDEWKECRISIDRFDRLLVDLRKYGFTLITTLLTAGSFVFVKTNSDMPEQLAAAVTLLLSLLIFALFIVDHTYSIFLRAAVARAEALENVLHFDLSKKIARVAKAAHADTWAHSLYFLFLIAAQVPWYLKGQNPSIVKLWAQQRIPLLILACGIVYIVLSEWACKRSEQQ